jgi:hypothetical protein
LRFSESDASANDQMEEELAVMTRLIERSMERGLIDAGSDEPIMGVQLIFTGSRSVRAMYLDGFGALFMVKVNFPVYAPDTKEVHDAIQPQESEWERARRDLFARSIQDRSSRGQAAYDPTQVEALKTILFQSLTNACYIHGLKADEWVSLSVFGRPPVAQKKAAKQAAYEDLEAPAKRNSSTKVWPNVIGQITRVTSDYAPGAPAAPPQNQAFHLGTVLTIRVKKADADAYAKGKIDFDAFSKKAQTKAYFGNGYGVLSVNSWTKERIAK